MKSDEKHDGKIKIKYSNLFTNQKIEFKFEFDGDTNIIGMIEIFRSVLLAIGYSEESINEYISKT